MIEIIDIKPKAIENPNEVCYFPDYPDYPRLEPDDVLFVSYSGCGSQGEHASYIVTYTDVVYRADLFHWSSPFFMERICPFLKKCDFYTVPDLENFFRPKTHNAFQRTDWCVINLWGANSLFIHATMAKEFANATKDFGSAEMYNNWLEVAVSLVRESIRKISLQNGGIMLPITDPDRFLVAQQATSCGILQVFEELSQGKKAGDWMPHVFPQLRCLGRTARGHYYGIADKTEAKVYLNNFLLGPRIRECARLLLEHKDKTALSIFGETDAVQLHSCMTMFDRIVPNDIFGDVLDAFYEGERCKTTLKALN